MRFPAPHRRSIGTLGAVIDVIGFDADDTLWHSQNHYEEAEREAADLVAQWVDADEWSRRLLAVERVNVDHYGFGAKSFTLSMIETAIDLSGGDLPASVVSGLVEIGRELLRHPVELIDGVTEVVSALTDDHHLVVVTKGDLLHQERKLVESGLHDAFDDVHIVSTKTPDTYRRLVGHHGITPDQMLMVGNSLASDVVPARTAGLHAAYVPYALMWAYEHHDLDDDHDIPTLESIHGLPGLVDALKRGP